MSWFLTGYKTYIAGFGLMGLAVWQFSQGEIDAALEHFTEGLGLIGLRSAVARK